MRFIKQDRPIAVIDIESTGLNPRVDRIIELAVVRLETDGSSETKTWLLNPTIPIPLETTAIHGLTDEMVASCPTFEDVAEEVFEFMKNCDLAGFGIGHLDIPILEEEFLRVGKHFGGNGRRQFDALRIYHKREPRDLTAALRYFCGEEYTEAHGAEADALAALRVLKAEFSRYEDLPTDPDALDEEINGRDPAALDRDGRFRMQDGEAIINFGKKKGQLLRDVAANDPSFLKWILRADFSVDTRKIAKDALAGVFPQPTRNLKGSVK